MRKVGYVRTGYASRNLSDIVSELNIYAGWVYKSQAFAMDGIFFDESPHQFSQEAVDLMLGASQAVKNAEGFQGSKVVRTDPQDRWAAERWTDTCDGIGHSQPRDYPRC